jgi:hypothetical protein
MNNLRWKNLILAISGNGALLFALAAFASAQHTTSPPPMPQPRESPNAPTSQNVPQGLDGPQLTPNSNRPSVDPENQQEIRAGVERLYALVVDLKNEVDRTNSGMVLNTTLVKRAQDIEKLAKQIKERAKR